MLEVQRWFLQAGACGGELQVCRVKNKFARGAVVADGYRDLSLSVIVVAAGGIGGLNADGAMRVVGEVQIHDRAMHELKLQVIARPSSFQILTFSQHYVEWARPSE